MNQETKQKIADVLGSNVGNRLTEELANGLLHKILSLAEEKQGKPLDTKEIDASEADHDVQG